MPALLSDLDQPAPIVLAPTANPLRFITTLVCLPPFVFAAVSGMRSADPAARELFASVAASPLAVLWRPSRSGRTHGVGPAGRAARGRCARLAAHHRGLSATLRELPRDGPRCPTGCSAAPSAGRRLVKTRSVRPAKQAWLDGV